MSTWHRTEPPQRGPAGLLGGLWGRKSMVGGCEALWPDTSRLKAILLMN